MPRQRFRLYHVEFQDSYINPHDSLWILQLLGRVIVYIDTERGEPLARGLLLVESLYFETDV